MKEKLDFYRPTREQIQGVRRQLGNAGVDPDLVPIDWAEALIAATFKWLSETADGGIHGANLLELEWFRGDDEMQYKIHDNLRQVIRKTKSEDVYLLRGAIVEGRSIPFSQLSFSEKESESCESCGIISHCTKTIRDPSTDLLERLCNSCIAQHGHPRVKDEAEHDGCEKCTTIMCPNHPRKERLA